MRRGIHLVIPVKTLDRAKTRLRGATDNGAGDPVWHRSLVLALVRDTVAAAAATPNISGLLVVTSDPTVAGVLAAEGIHTVPDAPAAGLNAALAHGAELVTRGTPGARVGALQADLPALRPMELAAALDEAGERRAFCADRIGTGTTLLLASVGGRLDPRFGPNSAASHAASGARPILGTLSSLRCDVDVADDLAAAAALGLGPRTSALLSALRRPSTARHLSDYRVSDGIPRKLAPKQGSRTRSDTQKWPL